MKNIFTFGILLISIQAFSQAWLNKNPNNRTQSEMTLYDYQQAFNEYWQGKVIDKGYYVENGNKKKAYEWKQFKRWENFWIPRVDKQTGSFPSEEKYQEANRQFQQNITRSESGTWTNMGPSSSDGGYAGIGRVNSVAFHPTDVNTFWVATPGGGVWKTSNGGSSWVVLTDNIDVQATSAIAIPSDYATSNTIYIGTGDRDAWTHNEGIGVLKSTDGGITWNATGLTFNASSGYSVNRILINPTDNNMIYAATCNGLYKTTDAGNNWTQIYSEPYLVDLEFRPNDPTILYASNKYWGRIYKFTNSGANVSVVYDEYDAGARRIELAVAPSNQNIVFAAVVDENSGLKEIIKSTDSGTSFSAVLVPGSLPNSSAPNILSGDIDGAETSGQGSYDLTLIVNPSNANTLYCGGINTWKSVNGGANWTVNNFWTSYYCGSCEIVHADKHFLAYNGSVLYECNDGGIYKSTNGTSWLDISNGLMNSEIYKIGVSQTEENSIIAGLQDNGSKLLHTDGNWYDVKGGDGMDCAIDFTDNNIQYASYVYGQITRTTDLWNSQTDIEPSSAGSGAWLTPYTIDPNNHNTLYAAYADVWKSTNKGDSWTKISTMNTADYLQSIAVAPSNSLYLYAADYDNIWKTINGGTSWTSISSGLPTSTSSITCIAVKNNDPNTVWVTFSGFNSDLIYQTTNGGTSWSNISTGLPSIPANTIVQNTQNTTETELYIGTEYGVYLKRGASNWEFFNTGLPKVVVTDLEIYYDANPDNSKLRAATYGRGLWESDLYSSPGVVPTADFTSDLTSIYEGETVVFTNQSTGGATSWNWTFNGGTPSSSTNQNPSVIYNTAGVYDVTLISSNTIGDSNPETKSGYITVSEAPIANAFTLDFEACTNYSTDFTPWSTVDGDGITTYASSDFDFTGEGTAFGFMAFNPELAALATPIALSHGGVRCGVAISPSNASQANDWLISDLLSLGNSSSITFWVLTAKDTWGLEDYEVLISTTNNSTTSFTVLPSAAAQQAPNTWTEKTYNLSAYDNQDIYIAIHYKSTDKFMFLIDDIIVETTSTTPPVGGTATASLSSICENSNTSIVLSNYVGNIQWQESINGTDWTNVSSGSGANSATYITPNLTTEMYYRAKLSLDGFADEFSTIANISINDAYNLSETFSICSGDDFTFPDGTTQSNITSTFVHISNLQTASTSCDSIITTTIHVNPVYNFNENVEICYNSNYTFPDGTTQTNITSQIVHISNLQTNLTNCDSTITTTLEVLPESSYAYDEIICEGESYILGSQVITDSGTYVEVFETGNGCYYTVTINLTVVSLPIVSLGQDTTICAQDGIVLGVGNSPSYNYLWSSGETSQTIFVDSTK